MVVQKHITKLLTKPQNVETERKCIRPIIKTARWRLDCVHFLDLVSKTLTKMRMRKHDYRQEEKNMAVVVALTLLSSMAFGP